MSYNETGTHKKSRIAHPWVLFMVLELEGTRSLPTPGLFSFYLILIYIPVYFSYLSDTC